MQAHIPREREEPVAQLQIAEPQVGRPLIRLVLQGDVCIDPGGRGDHLLGLVRVFPHRQQNHVLELARRRQAKALDRGEKVAAHTAEDAQDAISPGLGRHHLGPRGKHQDIADASRAGAFGRQRPSRGLAGETEQNGPGIAQVAIRDQRLDQFGPRLVGLARVKVRALTGEVGRMGDQLQEAGRLVHEIAQHDRKRAFLAQHRAVGGPGAHDAGDRQPLGEHPAEHGAQMHHRRIRIDIGDHRHGRLAPRIGVQPQGRPRQQPARRNRLEECAPLHPRTVRVGPRSRPGRPCSRPPAARSAPAASHG